MIKELHTDGNSFPKYESEEAARGQPEETEETDLVYKTND